MPFIWGQTPRLNKSGWCHSKQCKQLSYFIQTIRCLQNQGKIRVKGIQKKSFRSGQTWVKWIRIISHTLMQYLSGQKLEITEYERCHLHHGNHLSLIYTDEAFQSKANTWVTFIRTMPFMSRQTSELLVYAYPIHIKAYSWVRGIQTKPFRSRQTPALKEFGLWTTH